MDSTKDAPKNDLTELRAHLFDTLRGLKAKTVEPEDAKAINATAQVIINSAKIEVDYLRATGQSEDSTLFLPSAVPTPVGAAGIKGVTTHKLR